MNPGPAIVRILWISPIWISDRVELQPLTFVDPKKYLTTLPNAPECDQLDVLDNDQHRPKN